MEKTVSQVQQNITAFASTHPITPKKIESHPYFFLSLDLVNSTELKSRNEAWHLLLDAFYSSVDREVKKISGMQSWKYIGDEVLFFKRLHDMPDLEECVCSAYEAARTVTAVMRNIRDDNPQNYQANISVKGTAWVAKAVRIPPTSDRNKISREHRNLVVSIPADSGQSLKDFLGPDIDIGFRISKFARPNLLTVSAELTGAIFKKGTPKIAEKLRIVGYERLKGVWNNRYYPIVWFHDEWQRVDGDFEYDDRFDSKLVASAHENKDIPLTSNAIEKILDAVGHMKFTDEFLALLDSGRGESGDAGLELDALDEAGLEVHCVAICFNSAGQILVGKRPDNKKVMPGKWEFGCAQLSPGKSFFDAMKVHYRADFGVDITFENNDPIAQYYLTHKGVCGVIFVATANNPTEVSDRFLRAKHSEVRWIDPISHGLAADNCIPDFTSTIEKALEARNRMNGK